MSSAAPSIRMSPPGPDEQATIADISYRNYDGELRTRTFRWWAISAAVMRASVNRRRLGYWIPAAIILIIYLFLGIAHYLTQSIQARVQQMNPMAEISTANAYATTLYQGVTMTNLLVFIATLTIGAAAISADNRANALLVYLSKPLTRTDYLIGKWIGVYLLVAALTVTPALLMFLFFAVSYNDQGFLHDNVMLLPKLLVVSQVAAAIHTSLILGFSAWSKSPRLAGALYAAFYFISAILAGIIGQVLLHHDAGVKKPQVAAVVADLSVSGVINAVATNLYDVDPQQAFAGFQEARRRRRHQRHPNDPDIPPPPGPILPERAGMPVVLLIAGMMIVLPMAAASVRVRAVEVVRG